MQPNISYVKPAKSKSMKKTIFKLGLTGAIAVFLFALCIGCSSTDETIPFSDEDSQIISYAEQFATTHNDCLDYCLKHLNTSTKSNVEFASLNDFHSKIAELAKLYVEAHTTFKLKSSYQLFAVEFINSVTIPDIRKNMSDTELFFIDKTLAENPNKKEKLAEIIANVIADKTLSVLQKKAVCSFITVYEKSSSYWNKNRQEWLTLKTALLPNHITPRLAAWIAADCYWGWYGTVASGGNGIMGAGAAAVASGCMAMS